MVSETLEGGQYRKTDLPMMFSIGNGPLEKSLQLSQMHVGDINRLFVALYGFSFARAKDGRGRLGITSCGSRHCCYGCPPTQRHSLRAQSAESNTDSRKKLEEMNRELKF